MHLFKGTISVVLTVAYFACILVSGSILDLSKVHHELKGLSEPLRFQQRVSSCLGDVSDTSSSNCEVVTYLSDFMQLKAKVLNPLPEGAKIPKPDDVIEETGSYAKAFQDHIVNRKPFVQAMSPGYNNISMLMCWKDSQSFHEKVNTLTNDVALADCQKQQYDTILDRVTIPKVVAGSYIHKMDSKHVSGSNDLIDYRKQWPSLFAFDKNTMTVNWFKNFNQSLNLNPSNLFYGNQIINNKKLLVVNSKDYTYFLDSNNGSILFKVNFVSLIKPIISNDYFFSVTKNNLLICFDLEKRKVVYSYNINEKISEFLNIKKRKVVFKNMMIINNQIFIFLDNSYLLKFNLNGELSKVAKLPSNIKSYPILIDSSLIYLDTKNKVSIVD